jgi:hypothetical protein
MPVGSGFVDADGKMQLRLWLQVTRISRTRDITAFPPL